MEVRSFVFNPFQENTYVLYDETNECVIIDPGCYEKHEKDELTSFISDNKLKVKQLINTHCHIDHILGNKFIKEFYQVDLAIHQIDEQTLRAVKVYAPNYGFYNYEESEPDTYLKEGDKVIFGNTELEVLFVPGHAPGHIALYNKKEKKCIAGDVLFHRSIGRTDLPGGDHDTLINSIREKLFPLGEDVTVYPGHGPATNMGEEMRHNPFCMIY
ncbi:MBL fold metallo-hydrolase [Cytophagaceae bacterium ABcell3]|nr:MBL fold metallo-hydrolase [Cytophagaceae bacterium ABcell3]